MGELIAWVRRKAAELPTDWAGSVGWLYRQLGNDRLRLVGLSSLRTAAVLVGVASAAVNRNVLDAAVTASAGIGAALALVVGVQALSVVLSMGLSWVSTMLGERIANNLRVKLYGRLLGARWQDFSLHHSEQLLTRLTSDVAGIASGLTGTAVSLLAMVVQAVAAFALLWHYDATLAVFVAVLTPVALAASALVSMRLRVIQQQVQQAEADYRQRAQEVLAHEAVVKAFQAEKHEAELLARLQAAHARLLRRRAQLSVMASLVMGAAFTGSYLYAFVHGVLGIMAGTVSYGTFVAFLSLVGQVQSSLANLGGMLPRAASVVASVARVREVAQLPQEDGGSDMGNTANAAAGASADGESSLFAVGVRARGLTFAYDVRFSRPVIDNATFDIGSGQIAAVMGSSGAGKTTLVRLLLGLVEPTAGSLQLLPGGGGPPVPCARARSLVSYVPQGNTLLTGTIRDNLLVGMPGASERELRDALAAASALDFVDGLPDGMDTRIGERARGLSEGQAQRIAIARALVRPAGLLLLDEATSALDEDTELAVMQALRANPARPTCVVITHRRSVVPFCDRVFTVRDGKIAEVRNDDAVKSVEPLASEQRVVR